MFLLELFFTSKFLLSRTLYLSSRSYKKLYIIIYKHIVLYIYLLIIVSRPFSDFRTQPNTNLYVLLDMDIFIRVHS